jgi:flagellin
MPAITTNIAANSAVYYLNINSQQESSALSKLSSGSRITSASDDAAGLAISTRISSDITTLQQAATNAAQANAILQTADGGASNISDLLARMKSLASESASGTTVNNSQQFIQSEFGELVSEIDSIASGTRYSGQALLDGSSAFSSGVSVLVGSAGGDTVGISLSTLTTSALFGATPPSVSTQTGATAALSTLDTAITTVSNARALIGAQESRFNFSANSIATQTQNLQAANSAIKDVDVAAEQAALSSAEVKTQAAVAAETAANQMPQFLLKLLG